MMGLFVKIDLEGLKIQSFVLCITRLITRDFPRVHLLGIFDFEIISKYISLLHFFLVCTVYLTDPDRKSVVSDRKVSI